MPHARVSAEQAYTGECPVCGYTELIDWGPYEPSIPWVDDQLSPIDPEVHLMSCGRCGKLHDRGTEASIERQRAWIQQRHDGGIHHNCDPGECAWAAMGIWEQ